MANTKIICTIGPASREKQTLGKMLLGGMNIARFNMSHDNQTIHGDAIRLAKSVSDEKKIPLKIMVDLRGPEIRIGRFSGGSATLKSGQTFKLTAQNILGDSTKAAISAPQIFPLISVGERVLLSDGLVELCVTSVAEDVECKVLVGGKLFDNKSIYLPDTRLALPYLSENDKSDILFAVGVGADMIALSFVGSEQDVLAAREYLHTLGGGKIKLISKIESQLGIDNLEKIIKVSDGIMIARGDLGTEIPLEKLPHIQKNIIALCLRHDCFVITATEMLESMTEKPRPTRAEATDVANAVYDGTDAVMLSAETAKGNYPVLAVEYMYRLVDTAEQYIFSPLPLQSYLFAIH